MSITYNWSVRKLKVAEDNLVTQVDLLVMGTDGTVTDCAAYSCELVKSDDFVPYEQLTEQQVLGWCFAPKTIMVNGQEVTRHLKNEGEEQVAAQIKRQTVKKEFEPNLPWVFSN
jgi:hypothetical protein